MSASALGAVQILDNLASLARSTWGAELQCKEGSDTYARSLVHTPLQTHPDTAHRMHGISMSISPGTCHLLMNDM